ncbi:MAG: hypothetical protein IPK19_02925 [Chloroflexi bacterium]|nr:hypothetical protein [Chloroflexota bacterium]
MITRRDALGLAAAFAASRVALVIVGLAAMLVLPMNERADFTHLRDGGSALDMWYRWDATFYATIATYGYEWQNEGRPAADMAFMPVYPLTVRAASFLNPEGCPVSPYWSTCTTLGGLVVSNLALLASTYLLFWLTLVRFGRAAAWRATVLLLVSPISIFLSGVYTESLFLLLSLLTFVLLERRQYLGAVAAACLAALTRSVGLALCAGLLWYAWFNGADWSARRPVRLALAVLPAVVFAGYILWMGSSVGDRLAYFSTYELAWDRTAGTPIQAFTVYFSGEPVSWFGWTLSWLDLFLTLFYLVLAGVAIWRARGARRGEGVMALGGLIVPIMSGTLVGMPRFGAVLFPFYMLLGRWADKPWKALLVYGVSGALAVLFAIRFVAWRWIA